MPADAATQALVAERRAQILRLRIAAVPVPQIAERYGISEATVRSDISRALATRSKELISAADELRALELEKLEAMERAAWAVVHRQHPHVTPSGVIVRHPETGEILTDAGPVLSAIDRLLKIQERRAKLLGLDSVTKTEVAVTTPPEDVDAEIARLFAELVAGHQGPPPGHPEA